MLKDIGKIEWVKKCEKQAKCITRYMIHLQPHMGDEPYEEKTLVEKSPLGLLLHDLQKKFLRCNP